MNWFLIETTEAANTLPTYNDLFRSREGERRRKKRIKESAENVSVRKEGERRRAKNFGTNCCLLAVLISNVALTRPSRK